VERDALVAREGVRVGGLLGEDQRRSSWRRRGRKQTVRESGRGGGDGVVKCIIAVV
jgi:hypothetical protein